MQETSKPTMGQLEQSLSQRIQAWYRTHLGHQLSRVTCQLVDDKISIVLEGVITQPEQLLSEHGKDYLVEQVRSQIDRTAQLQLKILIEEVVKVPVIELLVKSVLKTGQMSTLAVLAEAPILRNLASLPQEQTERDSS